MIEQNKVIVISGASTGIGFCLACELAADGNKVYAGVRKKEDIEKLSAIKNISALELDITNPDKINAAVERVAKTEGHIDALINNAGVTGWGAAIDRDMEYFRRVIEINYFGHVQMIKAFYPLLRKSQSNPIIINVSSQAGNYAFPFWSAYHSSKWALEAFSHCLRRELLPFGIRVAIIQPGAIESQAFIKDTEDFERYKEEQKTEFAPYAVTMLDAAFNRKPGNKIKSPKLVARDVRRAIYGRRNAIYYQPGRRFIPDFIAAKLPYKALDGVLSKLYT